MPSLRRALSSPNVRPAPYALLNPTTAGSRAHGSGHRRSTGSETTGRRVLADIEWWRVADGQRDVVSEQELEEQDLDPDEEAHLPDQVAVVPYPVVLAAKSVLSARRRLLIGPRTFQTRRR
ncbi:hypothetical protein B0H13DRAFT_13433 [Mycena leptocephala]|nr:hypothetical protein B0H13DRAFT_13433 [Mycena leptocephala]